MNKIYSDQIDKAKSLSDGIKKQSETLKQQGITISTEAMDSCRRALHEVALKQVEAELALKAVRDEAHLLMEQLKEMILANKTPIKEHFALEQWQHFGIADKR